MYNIVEKGMISLKKIETNTFSLSTEDIAIIKTALDIFISNKIDEISDAKKFESNIVANQIKNRLDNYKLDFSHRDCCIIYTSLNMFHDSIEESIVSTIFDDDLLDDDLSDESKHYLDLSQSLINKFYDMIETFNSKMH